MASITALAEIGALVGDPGRANMLAALMYGRALTARELAGCAGIAPQTASGHLSRLLAAGMIQVERQGRHRYHRLASAEMAGMLETMMQVSAGPQPLKPPRTGPRDEAMRAARSCYDHLAGPLAVAIADGLVARGGLSEDGAAITPAGRALLADFGIELDARRSGSRPLCRLCLDWSERRPHLAGKVGALILDRSLELGWVRRRPASRTLTVTAEGRQGFSRLFGPTT